MHSNIEVGSNKSVFTTLGLLAKNSHFWLGKPEIENLPLIHLPIYKKIFVSGSKSKIFNNEAWFCYCQAQIFNLLVKILESDSETKIFLYIGEWINGKFSISGGLEDIFVNKIEFGQFVYLVKLWRCCIYPYHLFTISFCIKKSKNEPLTSHVDQSAP